MFIPLWEINKIFWEVKPIYLLCDRIEMKLLKSEEVVTYTTSSTGILGMDDCLNLYQNFIMVVSFGGNTKA